ncbi:MAG: Glu-tRNA(Gln) amidotransferase subunit GatE [Candidatus Krumholzibacteriota bacterium]|nr:Glu-tRNA(Gln) amidotransferase subunit GatE [Candidatus Krumholzibacteriota bacterium]
MAVYRKMEETTPEDYASMGLKSGIEIHQQLATEKKLFCRCPLRPYSDEFHAEILRHMRPTLSELGEYDGTALMEFKTKKEIVYQINKETVCTYEMDDTPPFELNEQALDIALEVTMLLNCALVSEVHIARKQYLDGSIPTGFQRTTILGVDGWIPYGDRRIGIVQLGLEEDACREVSDTGHLRVYRTDRLGIPLIETVTYPEMHTPREVADVAQILRWLVRSTGKVRTGIGAARQDVNVSVAGGVRVEIKGVPRIPAIPLLVHIEAFRQLALLDIKAELSRRGITGDGFRADDADVTDNLRGTLYGPVARALRNGHVVRAVALRGYRGILSTKTQPETIFAREISDRVRVIACLDRLPNIVHSDAEGENFSSGEWMKIKKAVNAGERDAVVVVWGGERDVETAVGEIAIRAREAIDGVVNETRRAASDGTTGFERILPGPDRMYPDTDLPPIAITADRIERIRAGSPERPWDRAARYVELGLSPDLAALMGHAPERNLFDELCGKTAYEPAALAAFLTGKLRHLRRTGATAALSDSGLVETIVAGEAAGLAAELLGDLVARSKGDPSAAAGIAADLAGAEAPGDEEIAALLSILEPPALAPDKLHRFYTGHILAHFGERFVPSAAAAAARRFMSALR